jgi:hypothetical protein
MNSPSLRILTLFPRFFLITAFIGCGSLSIVRAQGPLAETDPRATFPESTYFVFRSQNVQATTQAIAASPFGERLATEPWAALSAMHRQKNIPSILNTLPWMGIEWRELESVATEGYFIGFLDSKKQPHVAFMMHLGNDAATHPFVAAWKKAFSKDRTLKESKINNSVNVWHYEPKSPSSTQAVLAIGPQWTIISSSPIAITEWLTTKTSEKKTKSAVSEKIFATSTSTASVQFWLSPWPLLQSYTETREPKLYKSFSKLGLSQIRECVGEIQLVDKPVPAWNITAELQWTEPLQNAMAVLSLVEGNEIELPKIMQGTSPETKFDNYSILYLDNEPWFQGINYLADLSIDEDIPGGFADILDSLLTDPEGPKIDVRQDVIYKLGNPMIIGGSTIKDRKKVGQYQRQLLTAFPFPDTAEMRKLLQRMFESDEEVTHEDIGDFQIWHTVHNESLFISLSESETQTITAAAVDKTHVYLATDTQWLKSLIEEANRTTVTLDTSSNKNEPISIRQNFDLTSWLQKSWMRIPERTPDRKDYETTDLPALILTNTLVPQTTASDLPAWNEAKELFGSISVVGNKTQTGAKLSITWK